MYVDPCTLPIYNCFLSQKSFVKDTTFKKPLVRQSSGGYEFSKLQKSKAIKGLLLLRAVAS